VPRSRHGPSRATAAALRPAAGKYTYADGTSPTLKISASLATPTTSTSRRGSFGSPELELLPDGSRPGQNRRAVASVTIATVDPSVSSAAVNARPRTSGISSSEK